MTGINFAGVLFSEPRPVQSVPPYAQGVYVVLVQDATCSPRPFRPIYVGESDNLFNRVSLAHERANDWLAWAGYDLLWVSFAETPYWWDESTRRAVEDLIIRTYQSTLCNRAYSFDWSQP